MFKHSLPRLRKLGTLWIALALLTFVVSLATAGPQDRTEAKKEPQDLKNAEDLAFVYDGMKKARKALTSAIVKVKKKHYTIVQKEIKVHEVGDYTIAFDGIYKSYFDGREPAWVSTSEAERKADPSKQFKRVLDYRSRLFQNHDHFAIYKDNLSTATVDDPRAFDLKSIEGYFDPKAVGLYTTSSLNAGRRLPDFDRIAFGNAKDLKSITKTNDGIWKLTHEVPLANSTSSIRVIYDVHVNEGFSTRLIEIFSPGKNQTWVPMERAKTTWSKINGQWVPVESDIQSEAGARGINLTLNWSSVNQPIPETQFSLDALEIPDDVALMRMSFGELRMIRPNKPK